MKRTQYEQETVFLYNQAEPLATLDTYDRARIRKMDKLASETTEVTAVERGEGWAKYTFPKTWIKVHKPRRLTEAQRNVNKFLKDTNPNS